MAVADGPNKDLVAAKGHVTLYVGNRSLMCQVTGISTQRMVALSPDETSVGQYVRCIIKLDDLEDWIDADAVLVQQVQGANDPRRIVTLQFQSLAPPNLKLLEAYVSSKRHIGVKTGKQRRIATQKGVRAITQLVKAGAKTPEAKTPEVKTPETKASYTYLKVRKKTPAKPRQRTLAEELKDYLEDDTPIEEIYKSALDELDREMEKQNRKRKQDK